MSMDDMITPSGHTPWDQNGPHYYPHRTWLGSVKQGLTPERAFEMLRFFAASDQFYPVLTTGDESDAQITPFQIPLSPGRVKYYVFPEAMTIVNSTLPGHEFHPGNVFRMIVQDGDNIYLDTKGYGVGPFSGFNQTFGPLVWDYLDAKMRDQLNKPDSPYDRCALPGTNVTDREANKNDYDAISANQADLENAARIYYQRPWNGDDPEFNWP